MISEICWCSVQSIWVAFFVTIDWAGLGWPDEMVMMGHSYADKWGVVT